MLFKIDENLPVEVAHLLRDAGHDAVTTPDQQLHGQRDGSIAEVCLREQRILISLDVDFADIRTYPPEAYPGMIVLRLHQQDKSRVLRTRAST